MDLNYRLQPIQGEIVIVEDDVLLRDLMLEILVDVGAQCVAFASADDALVHLLQSERQCALVVTDHGLPGQIQGVELAFLVRNKWPAIPVIITSGWSDAFIGLPESTRFLPKPWTIEHLVVAVASLLQPDAEGSVKPVLSDSD